MGGCASSKPSSSSKQDRKSKSSPNKTKKSQSTENTQNLASNINKNTTNNTKSLNQSESLDLNKKIQLDQKSSDQLAFEAKLNQPIKINADLIDQIEQNQQQVIDYIVRIVHRDLNAEIINSNGTSKNQQQQQQQQQQQHHSPNLLSVVNAISSAQDNDDLINDVASKAILLLKNNKPSSPKAAATPKTFKELNDSLKKAQYLFKNQSHKNRICDLTVDTIKNCLDTINEEINRTGNKFNLIEFLNQHDPNYIPPQNSNENQLNQLTPPQTPEAQKVHSAPVQSTPNNWDNALLLSRAQANEVARILFLSNRARPVVHASPKAKDAYFVNKQLVDNTEITVSREEIDEILNSFDEQPKFIELVNNFDQSSIKISPISPVSSSLTNPNQNLEDTPHLSSLDRQQILIDNNHSHFNNNNLTNQINNLANSSYNNNNNNNYNSNDTFNQANNTDDFTIVTQDEIINNDTIYYNNTSNLNDDPTQNYNNNNYLDESIQSENQLDNNNDNLSSNFNRLIDQNDTIVDDDDKAQIVLGAVAAISALASANLYNNNNNNNENENQNDDLETTTTTTISNSNDTSNLDNTNEQQQQQQQQPQQAMIYTTTNTVTTTLFLNNESNDNKNEPVDNNKSEKGDLDPILKQSLLDDRFYNNNSFKTDPPINGEKVNQAATTIQANFKGHNARQEIHSQIEDENPALAEQAATTIQANFRGYKTRKDIKEKTGFDHSEFQQNLVDNSDLNQIGNTIEHNTTTVTNTTTTSCSSPTSNEHDHLNTDKAATKIQATYRGFKTRKELNKKDPNNQAGRKD